MCAATLCAAVREQQGRREPLAPLAPLTLALAIVSRGDWRKPLTASSPSGEGARHRSSAATALWHRLVPAARSQDFFFETRRIEFLAQHFLDADAFSIKEISNEQVIPQVQPRAQRVELAISPSKLHHSVAVVKVASLGNVIGIAVVLPDRQPPVRENTQIVKDKRVNRLVREVVAERPLAGHLVPRGANETIGVDMRSADENIVGERWIGQAADLVADVGEEDKAPLSIADIDPDLLGGPIAK